jgi:ATP-binding cassette subfamily B protein
MQPPIENANWKTLQLYLSYWRRFPRLTVLSLLFSLMLALQQTVVPLLVSIVLGQLIHTHAVNTALLVFAGLFQLVTVLASYVLDDRGSAILHHRVEDQLYEDSFEYLAHQDYSFFTNRFSGAIVTQASRFAKVYSTFHDTMIFDLLPQLASLLIIIGVISYYSPLIGFIVLVLWLFISWVVVRLALKRLPVRRTAVAKESRQIGELADVINNSLTVKTFAAEDREIERYAAVNELRGRFFLRSWHQAVRNGWIIHGLAAIMQMTVFVGGVIAVQHQSLEIATFVLFQFYILRIIDNIHRSVNVVRQLEVVAGDAQEMAELLEQPPFIQDKPFATDAKISQGAISFENVNFQYEDASTKETLFADFSLQIKPGEKVGLVGPSGGGKTTITRLLLRFMDIQDGSIRIDDHDIRDIKQQTLRRSIAYVPQEPLLFHRSIKENIRYGKPTASDEEVIDVAKKSFAHDFIKDLPEGYDTLVGERGVKLSGGQRQRVAIARAMLTDVPILILDEATSALDSESERYIQKALWELMKDKTAVVIAHRLSTIQRLDRIVVLDDGKVIEQGSHSKLLEQKGLYARLWKHQSGGFLED